MIYEFLYIELHLVVLSYSSDDLHSDITCDYRVWIEEFRSAEAAHQLAMSMLVGSGIAETFGEVFQRLNTIYQQ